MTITDFQPSPTTMHPLMGANLRVLVRSFVAHGGVSARCLPLAGLFVASALARSPFSLLDRGIMSIRRPQEGCGKAPVFIVGYWRSGTTHLHNLMACSPGFGIISPLASGLPGELLTLARWFRPLLERSLPDTRGVDQVAVTPNSPQEDEIPIASMHPFSVFHALYFPRHFRERFNQGVFFDDVSPAEVALWERRVRYFMAKVVRHQGRETILVKNPVYTARIRQLLAIWPDAKFVHIYRNPYDVFASSVHYFTKMIGELAMQKFEHLDIAEQVLETYPRMLDRLSADTAGLPSRQFCEVRYEQLEAAPGGELKRIFGQLELPGWSEFKGPMETYLRSISRYSKNRYAHSDAQCTRVASAWLPYIERWGYERPGGDGGS